MRVNVLVLPANSNAEPTPSSRDCAENNPAGGFFNQIDQIWNQNKAADAAGGEKRTDQDEPKAEKDPLTMMTGVALIPENPQLPVLPPGLPDDLASQVQPAAPSIETSGQPNVPVRILDKTSMAALFVKEAGNLLGAAALNQSGKPTVEAVRSTEDSSIPADGDSVPVQKTSANPLNSIAGLERSQPSAYHRVSDPSTPEPSKSNPDATLVARAAVEHSRNLSQRADSITAAERVEFPDSLRMSIEPDKAGDAVPAAVQGKPGNIIMRATLENAGTDNSHADGRIPAMRAFRGQSSQASRRMPKTILPRLHPQ